MAATDQQRQYPPPRRLDEKDPEKPNAAGEPQAPSPSGTRHNDPPSESSHGRDGESQPEDGNGDGAQEPGEDDPELGAISRVSTGPPYSVFSPSMKWWIVAMNVLSAFISPVTANIYFPAIPVLARDLGATVGQLNLTITSFMIFQGLAPAVFGDFGDAAGRRPAFLIATAIYLGANLGLALQRDYAALLVLRMLQSTGSSGTLALVYAVVADIAPSAERGRYMGILGAGLTVGPALGPIVGGLLSQYLGWPSIFWFLCVMTVVWMVPYVLTVPETGRKVVGNGSTPPQPWNMTLPDYVRFRRRQARAHPEEDKGEPAGGRQRRRRQRIPIPNPFNTLAVVLQKDMAVILFFNGLLYIGFMLVNTVISTQYAAIYGFDELRLGLCYLPVGAGCCVSSVSIGFVLDWNFRREAAKLGMPLGRGRGAAKGAGNDLAGFPIERARLQLTWPMIAVGTVAYIGWGWSLEREVHVAVPLVLSFFIGLLVTGAFQVVNVLIVDLYPESPATATAANNLVRCSMGAVMTAVVDDIIRAMGRGWAFTFIALLFAVPAAPTLWVIQTHGPRFREQRRLKMLEKKRKQEEQEEAEAADDEKAEPGAQGAGGVAEPVPSAGPALSSDATPPSAPGHPKREEQG